MAPGRSARPIGAGREHPLAAKSPHPKRAGLGMLFPGLSYEFTCNRSFTCPLADASGREGSHGDSRAPVPSQTAMAFGMNLDLSDTKFTQGQSFL